MTTKQLRDYQIKLKYDVHEAWQAGNRNVCAVAPTGSGKTLTMTSLFDDMQVVSVAIAHRQELVGQMSLTFAELGVTHRLIAPNAVIAFCIAQHIARYGRSFYHPQSPIGVAGIDTLIRRATDLQQWFNQVRVWDIDECFPAGTAITTPTGLVPIEQLRKGDQVIAFDEKTGQIVVRTIDATMSKPMPSVMTNVWTHRSKVRCTLGHPFWTKRGWIEAGDLTLRDSVMDASGQWCRIKRVFFDVESCGSDQVYNLEVRDVHTYVAEGVVVHNCHHLLRDNKWGKGVALFPNAYGVGFTATPKRADRKSLSRARDGLFDAMVLGPTMRTLMEQGHLAQAKVFGPAPSIDRSKIEVSKSTGELNHTQTVETVHKSRIVGDIVDGYLKFAPGKRGITFVVDIDQAVKTAEAYNARGVRAVAVSSKTPDAVRVAMIDKFRAGNLDQLVNVDLFGEGMDVPAVEVVSMGRPTESFGLYTQQFGRCMRTAKNKTHGIVIDHVENVKVHKLPWRDIDWSLDDEETGKRKKRDNDVIPVTTCTTCFQAFEAVTSTCPHCGARQIPAGRSLPEQVDGDLFEYGPELMEQLGGEVRRIDGPALIPHGASEMVERAIRRNWEERQQAQAHLRDTIALWAGIGRDVYGRSDSEMYRIFYHTYGISGKQIDVMTAKTLSRSDAEKLRLMINEDIEDDTVARLFRKYV